MHQHGALNIFLIVPSLSTRDNRLVTHVVVLQILELLGLGQTVLDTLGQTGQIALTSDVQTALLRRGETVLDLGLPQVPREKQTLDRGRIKRTRVLVGRREP